MGGQIAAPTSPFHLKKKIVPLERYRKGATKNDDAHLEKKVISSYPNPILDVPEKYPEPSIRTVCKLADRVWVAPAAPVFQVSH